MKHYKGLTVMFLLISFVPQMNASLYDSTGAYYSDPTDYSIVNQIHQKSSLTQADVDKIKLIRLGAIQDTVAGAAGAYATYKGGTTAYQLLSKLGGYAPTDNNKLLWALTGAAAVAFGSYKTLYPRTQQGILDQIEAFVYMCRGFGVTTTSYTTQTLETISQLQGNAMWMGSNIAREKGIEDLLTQCGAAAQLLDQLEPGPKITALYSAINNFRANLLSNQALIKPLADRELQNRKNNISSNITGAQQIANLREAQRRASLLQVSTISLAVTTLSNFFKKSLETLVYVNDNKEKIAGGLLIGSAAVYGSLMWLKSKIYGN